MPRRLERRLRSTQSTLKVAEQPEFLWLCVGNGDRAQQTEHLKLLNRAILPEFLCLVVGTWARAKHLELLCKAIMPEFSCLDVGNLGCAQNTEHLKLLNRRFYLNFRAWASGIGVRLNTLNT